jgi:hypothetical protein
MADTADQIIADLKAQLIQAQGYRARAEALDGLADIGRAAIIALRAKGLQLPSDGGPGAVALVGKYIKMGKDFDTLMDAIKRDHALQSDWERFCMMLKLSEGNDEA